VRHGESEGNRADQLPHDGVPAAFWDRHPSSWQLTDAGRRDAERAGRVICERLGWTGGAKVVSPATRTLQTALALGLGYDGWRVDPAVAERAWGHEQRGLTPRLRQDWLRTAAGHLARDPWGWSPPGGENLLAVQVRMWLAVRRHRSSTDGPVLVVSHGEAIAVLREALEGPSSHAAGGFAGMRLPSGGMVAYGLEGDRAKWVCRPNDNGGDEWSVCEPPGGEPDLRALAGLERVRDVS